MLKTINAKHRSKFAALSPVMVTAARPLEIAQATINNKKKNSNHLIWALVTQVRGMLQQVRASVYVYYMFLRKAKYLAFNLQLPEVGEKCDG
jgi:hypothetical protein